MVYQYFKSQCLSTFERVTNDFDLPLYKSLIPSSCKRYNFSMDIEEFYKWHEFSMDSKGLNMENAWPFYDINSFCSDCSYMCVLQLIGYYIIVIVHALNRISLLVD